MARFFALLIVCMTAFQAQSLADFASTDRDDKCDAGWFHIYGPDFKIGRVKGGGKKRVYFVKGHSHWDDCPKAGDVKCQEKEYLVPGDRVYVARSFGPWICTWHKTKKGEDITGWIPAKELEFTEPDPKPSLGSWAGNWRNYDDHFNIVVDKKRQELKIEGRASWHNPGITTNYGNISATGKPEGTELKIKEHDCEVHLRLIGDILLVGDNFGCGGSNVRFDGVYRR